MKRLVIGVAVIVGLVIFGAACQPFGTPGSNDYVVFQTCAEAPCSAGNENILLMRAPVTTTNGSVTTRTGDLELRALGRDHAYHNYSFASATITEDAANPGASSIEFSGASGAATGSPDEGTWNNAFGVAGLTLSNVAFVAHQDPSGAWIVNMKAKPSYVGGSAAEALVPGHELAQVIPTIPIAPGTTIPTQLALDLLSNRYSIGLSDLDLPMTVEASVPVDVAQENIDVHVPNVTITKVSTSDHATTFADATDGLLKIGAVSASNVNLAFSINDRLQGSVLASGFVTSTGETWNITAELPFEVGFSGPDIIATIGPNASLSATSPTTNISFTGTISAALNAASNESTFSLSDGTLIYNSMSIEGLSIRVTTGGSDGVGIDLHANSATLTPQFTVYDVDLGWHRDVLSVHGSATLTGLAEGTVTVAGTAVIQPNGDPLVELDVTVPALGIELPAGSGNSARSVKIEDAGFHVQITTNSASDVVANLSTGHFAVGQGFFGNNSLSGNFAVTGSVRLTPSWELTGWKANLALSASLGSLNGTAAIHGSGGTLYDGPPMSPMPAGFGKLEGVVSIIDPGNGIGGMMTVSVYHDANAKVHLEAAGNAHLTVGSKVVIDGAVSVADNIITVDADTQFGTSLTAPVNGTITLDPNNITAIPTVDLTIAKTHLSQQLWIDQVHVTNAASLIQFTIDGTISNSVTAKALGMQVVDVGTIEVDGWLNLASANLANATSGNITYDLALSTVDPAPTATVNWAGVRVQSSGLTFTVNGDSHSASVDLEAYAAFGSLGVITGNVSAKIDVAGTVNFDSGVVNITGNAGAQVFATALGLASATGSATVNVSLTGNLNTSLNLSANGSGYVGANFIGIPVASGSANLGGSVQIDMTNGSLSGSANVNWNINVVGGVAGNHDGNWNYTFSGTASNPIITSQNSSWRDNHDRALNINGQVSPVKNLCGTHQKLQGLVVWVDDGTWGECNITGFISGSVLVDADASGNLSGPDAPLPTGAQGVVKVYGNTAANPGLVGQATVLADGTFQGSIVVKPGLPYRVELSLPSGYKYNLGKGWGYNTLGGSFTWPTVANQTTNLGTFGVKIIQWGALTGSVYNDANIDGVQNAGETGVSGVTVEVADSTGNVRTTVTDSSGIYVMNLIDRDETLEVTVQTPGNRVVTGDPDGNYDGIMSVPLTAATTTAPAIGLCQSNCGLRPTLKFKLYDAAGHPMVGANLRIHYQGTGGATGSGTAKTVYVPNGDYYYLVLGPLASGSYQINATGSVGLGMTFCTSDGYGGSSCGSSGTFTASTGDAYFTAFSTMLETGDVAINPADQAWPW